MTDRVLADLEKRITGVYRDASDELEKTVQDYFAGFAKRDAEQKERLDAGEITEEYYTQWRLNQIGRGERWEALCDQVAERMTNANEVAVACMNDATPGIYSLNRNYTAYTIEQTAGNIGFTLWDEQTVKRLIVEQPDLMPYYPERKAVKRGIDLAWGKKQITASVTSGILQGKSVKSLADDLQTRIPTMNRDSAIRTARTAVTGAQNAGRQDTYTAAKKMGISVRKRWIATKDSRTRHDHGMADGQTVESDKPFDVGGCALMFPGDMESGAPGHLLYNCRCTMRTAEKEGIEAEPRKMRVQTPEYTKAIEEENREREKYNRVLKAEQEEEDIDKRAVLREKRLVLQKKVKTLETKRRKTQKNTVVNEMTYTEWKEWVKRRGS